MTSTTRELIRRERNKLKRKELEALGYVLDYLFVYRVDFEARIAIAIAHPLKKTEVLRSKAKGSSKRLHEERMKRFRRD